MRWEACRGVYIHVGENNRAGLDSSAARFTIWACATLIDSQVTDPLTHYIIVRSDLPRGLQSAQIAHAAGESSPGNLPQGTHAIVLGTTLEQLAATAKRLDEAGWPYRRIVENDGDFAGQATAIGAKPGRRSQLKKLFSALPLLR